MPDEQVVTAEPEAPETPAAETPLAEPKATPDKPLPASIEELYGQIEAERPKAEAESGSEPEAEPEPEAGGFDPAKEGFPEPEYRNCKSLAECAKLARERHANAEAKIKAQGEELGRLRKVAEAPPKPPEAEPKPAAEPQWTDQQRDEWRQQFTEAMDNRPEDVVRAIQQPVLDLVDALKKELAEVKKTALEAHELPGRMAEAQTVAKVGEEWSGFLGEHPDAADMAGKDGALIRMVERVNGTDDRAQWTRCDYGETYALVKMERENPALFGHVLELVQVGQPLEKAKFYGEAALKAEANGRAEKERLVTEAKRKARLPGGKGSAIPSGGPVTALSMADYYEQHQM